MRWRCRPKRVPIRKLRLHSWYYLRRNSNLYDILFLVNPTVGNTILVKLELWESVMVIIIFGLPLTYAYATLRQSVAGNSTFRGIVFCNLGTPKTVISNFVPTRQIETPYSSPCKYGHPNNFPAGQKNSTRKKRSRTNMY